MKIIVLGGGMVGSAMARDLADKHEVSVADLSQGALEQFEGTSITGIQQDLSDFDKLKSLVQSYDLVIGAVPGFMGFEVFKSIIEAGKNIVDISFFPEDALQLDELAKKHNVIACMDCGVAPGMDNIFLGYHDARMEVNNFECLVGGLPKKREWPYAYKAPFSPVDVIEEYTRPARYVEHGEIVVREALTDPELIEFKEVGTLESFNTDGLRSIIHTMKHIPNLKEKTLRYPGHIEYMRVLRETGFFSKDKIDMGGQQISPVDFTSKLLFPKWKLQDREPEFTIMRVVIQGKENGKDKTYEYRLYDEFDEASGISSMARTTGYTCTGVAEMVMQGIYKTVGVSVPEFIGKEEACYQFILDYQKQRGIQYTIEES